MTFKCNPKPLFMRIVFSLGGVNAWLSHVKNGGFQVVRERLIDLEASKGGKLHCRC